MQSQWRLWVAVLALVVFAAFRRDPELASDSAG